MTDTNKFASANTSNIPTTKLGDANVYQGSVLGNLNTVPQNTNLNITSGDEKLGLWKQTTLSHTTAYSYLEEVNATQPGAPAGPTTQTVLQFSVTEWCDTQDFYLDLPVQVTTQTTQGVSGNAGVGWANDPMVVNNPAEAISANAWLGQQYTVLNLGSIPFENGLFPDHAILQILNSFEVYGGTNNQPLGKSFMMFAPNITQIATNDRISAESAEIYGYTGLPVSNVKVRPFRNFVTTAAVNNFGADPGVATYSTGGMIRHKVHEKTLQAFERVVRMASASCGATRVLNAGVNTWTSQEFIISIPLSMISEFFKTKKYVPPEMRFKISMSTFNAGIPIYTGFYPVAAGGGDSIGTAVFTLKTAASGSRATIRSLQQVLQPALQNALNEKWARNVITYNIDTKDPYDVVNRNPYTAVINVSMQRPLQLEIVAYATVTGGAAGGANLPANTFPNTDTTGIPATTTRYIANQMVPWLSATYTPVVIQNIKVWISGRPVIEWRNDYAGSGEFVNEGWNNVISKKYYACNQMGNNQYNGQTHPQTTINFNQTYIGGPIIIPLTPDLFWDNGIYPTDQGATQIKLQITTLNGAALHPDFGLRVYKLYTQQLSLDTNQKVTLTEWPARVLQGGNSSTLSQPPVVPGN